MAYKFKLVSFKTEDDSKWNEEGSNNIDYLIDKAATLYQNYYHKLFVRSGARWKELSLEVLIASRHSL